MEKNKKTKVQVILIIGVLLVGVLIMAGLFSLKKPPAKKEQAILYPLLNAIEVSPKTVQMTVDGYGTVEPRSNVSVVPQVSGRVVACHKQWVDGGFFKAGEPLLKIEAVDYKLAVQSAEAAVAQAEVALQQEQAEALTARTEWETLHPGQRPQSALVFREPQIKNAQAQLKAARAQLEKARLDLKRTTITMPFDGRIVTTTVDKGQFVTAGAPVATVYRTDLVEITVPLENKDLQWFQVPLSMNDLGNPDQQHHSPATVYANFEGRRRQWQGRVVRTGGQIDEKTRLVPVVVQVNHPFAVHDGQVPLVPGMFVDVKIQGRKIDNIFRIPRYAIRDEKTVWLARDIPEQNRAVSDPNEGSENEPLPRDQKQLRFVPVEIIRMDKNYAYVSKGLEQGDILITSPLETVTDGMLIRVIMEGQSDAQENTL